MGFWAIFFMIILIIILYLLLIILHFVRIHEKTLLAGVILVVVTIMFG